MPEPLRPLGIVKEIVEEIGHEITYAYDDLVFIEHNDFLLQFIPEPNRIDLFFNTECPPDEADAIALQLVPTAAVKGLTVKRSGTYSINPSEDDNLTITFHH
jgi:hypothetical protein